MENHNLQFCELCEKVFDKNSESHNDNFICSSLCWYVHASGFINELQKINKKEY